MIFPMQSLEFTKSLNFGSFSRKKNDKKNMIFQNFHLNMFFMVLNLKLGICILIDLNQIFPMKPSEMKPFQSKFKMKKRLRMAEIATLPESTYSFQSIKDINPKF